MGSVPRPQLWPQQAHSQDMAGALCSSHQPGCPYFPSLCPALSSVWIWEAPGTRVWMESWGVLRVLTLEAYSMYCAQVVQGMSLKQGEFLLPAQLLDCERSPVYWALISGLFLIFIQQLFNSMYYKFWKSLFLKAKPAVSSQDPPTARQESHLLPDASLGHTNTALLAEDRQFLQQQVLIT